MAEGWAHHLKKEEIHAYSAGVTTHGLNRIAVSVMAEAGVDISRQRSKKVKSLLRLDFDYVVTVCDDASDRCPVFPGKARIVHQSFDDPPRLAASAVSDEEAIGHYRRVRDEIRAFVETMPASLEKLTKPATS